MTATLTRDEIAALLEGITPGDWYSDYQRICTTHETGGFQIDVGETPKLPSYGNLHADAKIMAKAPTLARQLLALMEREAVLLNENETMGRAISSIVADGVLYRQRLRRTNRMSPVGDDYAEGFVDAIDRLEEALSGYQVSPTPPKEEV